MRRSVMDHGHSHPSDFSFYNSHSIIFLLYWKRFDATFVRLSKIDFVRVLFRKFGDCIQCYSEVLSAEPAPVSG